MKLELRTFVVDEFPTEFLMLAKCQLADMIAGYESFGLTAPEWVSDKLEQINKEIEIKVRAELMRKIKKSKALRETYKTKAEKRTDLDTSIEADEALLASLG